MQPWLFYKALVEGSSAKADLVDAEKKEEGTGNVYSLYFVEKCDPRDNHLQTIKK